MEPRTGHYAYQDQGSPPQTNGICEHFHKTILQEFYLVTFRRKVYCDLAEMQHDLDIWLEYYNNERTHQGKMCCGRTPWRL
ncbi:MAG: transposase [Gammaproteobacteria bacterium]|nr:transposase [Gammaproteobacteria bacterium]